MILVSAYLIGYFISFGLIFGAHEKWNFNAFGTAFIVSWMSWINVGIFLSDFVKEKIK